MLRKTNTHRHPFLVRSIAGCGRVPVCGWLLETYDSWDGVFLLFASSYVLGALLFFVWVGDKEID